jgi:hypothetical protein
MHTWVPGPLSMGNRVADCRYSCPLHGTRHMHGDTLLCMACGAVVSGGMGPAPEPPGTEQEDMDLVSPSGGSDHA